MSLDFITYHKGGPQKDGRRGSDGEETELKQHKRENNQEGDRAGPEKPRLRQPVTHSTVTQKLSSIYNIILHLSQIV